jgi:hypothetical protein
LPRGSGLPDFLVSHLKDDRKKSPRGAEARTDARRQNPGAESPLGPHRWDSEKERGYKGFAFLSTQKSMALGKIHRRIPVGSGAITAYFGKRSGAGFGSWHEVLTFLKDCEDVTLEAGILFRPADQEPAG